MGVVEDDGTYSEPTLDYRVAWDDAGRCSLYAVPAPVGEGPGKRSGPPRNKGPRTTDRLTSAAVRTIRGAAVKAAKMGSPLRVMWSFTVAETLDGPLTHPRAAVASGDLVLSQELSRFLDAFGKYRERRQDPRPFVDVWVAENPLPGRRDERDVSGRTRRNTRNPHIHLLTNWTFEPVGRTKASRKAEWLDFAEYIERLWGLGWVHMEFLENADAAGGYLLKAAGYLTKDAYADRPPEPVRGQRWYVSDSIRPVRQSAPVALDREQVRRLYALRRLAKQDPVRFTDEQGSIVFGPWCVCGYGQTPDAFVPEVLHLSGAYYFAREFLPDAEALAAADEDWARRLRREQAAREWEAERGLWQRLTPAPAVASGDPYEMDPDPADLVPVEPACPAVQKAVGEW